MCSKNFRLYKKYKMKIQEMILLKDYSTFKIGGPAKYFAEVETLEGLKESIEWAQKEKEKFMILGGGSNILFNDRGFNGLVIRLVNKKIGLIGKDDYFLWSRGHVKWISFFFG